MKLDAIQAINILKLIDLTSLEGTETSRDIIALCESATGVNGHVAAVCVYPQFIQTAKDALTNSPPNQVAIATVVNFPQGDSALEVVLKQIESAIKQGAQEIDLVLPYKRLLAGDIRFCQLMLNQCRQMCGADIKLKVIIESGVLQTPEMIRRAAQLVADCGADFIKTSTGKVPVNATLDAAETILHVIKSSGRTDLGFKASGGIRSIETAAQYIALCEDIMGPHWLTPEHFRFGASALLNKVNDCIAESQSASAEH